MNTMHTYGYHQSARFQMVQYIETASGAFPDRKEAFEKNAKSLYPKN